MPATDVTAFVRAALPAPPARVLEVGAGEGELAGALAAAGYDVVAIDPAAESPAVRAVALHELEEGPFDAAVAVVSLHHVEPLEPSCARLAELVRPGGRLAIDELDVEALDERAAAWWCERRGERGLEAPHDPATIVAEAREHLHAVALIRAALAPAFARGACERVPYMYRWELEPELSGAEREAIAAGRMPAVGARFTGVRR
jgi:SAM-dependent methyltransferase